MTRKEYEEFYKSWCISQTSGDAFALIANNYIFNLELTIKTLNYNNEAQEIIIRDQKAIIEEMSKPKVDFIDTSCARCKNVSDCSLCENVKNETGMKLKEMSFFCFEPKTQ